MPDGRLVAAIAFGAALLGTLSGGSTSLLTTPAWVALGAPFPAAVAADKVAATVWTMAAARSYLRRSAVDWRLLGRLGASGLIGAAAGALLATTLDERWLRKGAALLILGVLGWSLRRRASASAPLPDWTVPAAGLPLGIYEGVLGSGNAIFTTVLLQRVRGWTLPTALGHYYAVATGWCGLAAVVYLHRGALDWSLALPVTAGSLAGALVGSRLGARFGSVLIRPLFLGAGVLLALRLFFT
ncbi:MAG TPA: sulfite exporter TauE/SafE family protein [Gemmatimonadales bacterium]